MFAALGSLRIEAGLCCWHDGVEDDFARVQRLDGLGLCHADDAAHKRGGVGASDHGLPFSSSGFFRRQLLPVAVTLHFISLPLASLLPMVAVPAF